MKQKKDGTTKTLVLSLVSLMVAVVWMSAFVTVTSSYPDLSTAGVMIVLLIGVVFLIAGISGLFRWSAMRKAGGKKTGPAVWIILGIVAVLIVFQMFNTLPIFRTNGKLASALKGYVKEEFSSEQAKMPEDPWFVFYNNGIFSSPSSEYLRGTDDPSKVNVVVMYEEGTAANGDWIDKNSGQYLGDAEVQQVTLYVVRLDDWALIDKESFSQQLDYGENGINVLGMNEVQTYLNDLIK